MPWYVPWSESIKKRSCRYLLQRYLGQFLEEKLTLDQLTVDLYNGTGTVSDVKLDVQALNELGEQQNFPVEFVDGFISEMCVSIPWASLLSDSSFVEVTGLTLTVQPKQRADTGTSMFESMWSSMTSSMQLAKECFKQERADTKDSQESQPLEGLELFAQTIDSILSRVKVKFLDTVIRIEHVPKDSNSGVGLEIRIKNLDYFDEAGADPPAPSTPEAHLQQGNKMYQVAAFTTKKFYLKGITLYTDEFPSKARTFSRSVMTMSSSSTPDSKNSDNFNTAPVTPSDPLPHSNLSTEANPILFGKLNGCQEVRLRLKQSEVVVGPKVDIEVNLGSLTMFLSARQLHVLLELLHGLATPDLEDTSNVTPRARCMEKPMDSSDFHRVEQELLHQLQPSTVIRTKGLQNTQGWSTASLDDSDEEFLPMKGGVMIDSMLSSVASMDGSVLSSGSSVSTSAHSGLAGSFSPTQQHTRNKSHKGAGVRTLDTDPNAEVSHFHVRLSSVVLVLLHEDILTLCVESDGSSLARSSVQQMKSVAQHFFSEIGLFAVSGYDNKDFIEGKKVFERACQLNHIRLLSAPVIIEGNEKTTSLTSSISSRVTAASLELLECLVDKPAAVEVVELLKFLRSTTADSPPVRAHPDLVLEFKYCEKFVQRGNTRRFGQPRTDISVTLQSCCSELDVSIVDRITALLNPQPLCKRNPNKFSGDEHSMNQQSCFYQAVENSSLPVSKLCIKISSPLLIMKQRFPTPDLRPIHDMDRPPWWKRSVRRDFLTFELTDVSFQTIVDSRESSRRYEVQCRDIYGLFQEADNDSFIPFIRTSVDDKNGNSLPDGGQGFGWPRIVVHIHPVNTQCDLDDMTEMDVQEPLKYSMSESMASAGQQEPSPFSSKKSIHKSDTPHTQIPQGEELLVIPGDRQEMSQFIEHASRNCRIQLEINLPTASVHLPSKHLYELIYNRINTDMFLWEPAAPKPAESYSCRNTDSAAELVSTFLQDTLYPAFSICKSGIQYDSDSDSEDNDGVYYSVYDHGQRQKRKQQMEKTNHTGQSKVAITLSISQGVFNIYTPVRDSSGNVIPGQHGEIELQVSEGNLFSVSGYKGNAGLGFVCLQVNQADFYHNGLVTTPQEMKLVGSNSCSNLDRTIYRSDCGSLIKHTGNNKLDMLTVSIRIQADETTHNLKTFRVAAGVRGATLRHRMCASNHSWFTQVMDFFDVMDYPVAGYNPPGVITELHMHFWDCAVDYRPLHLPLKSMITVGTFSVSSNIAAQTNSSTLRFIAEDAALFITDKIGAKYQSYPVDLRKDYVCVVDLGLFELSLRLCDKTSGQNSDSPRVDLRASNNVLHVHTCSDSAKALTELLIYFSMDGDMLQSDSQCSHSKCDQILVNTGNIPVDDNQNDSNNLSKSQVDHVHHLMEEAMKDTHGTHQGEKSESSTFAGERRGGVEVFFFPDENHPLPARLLGDSEMNRPIEDDDDDDWEDDFCILEKEAGSGIMYLKNGLPELRTLTPEPVRMVDNHFSLPLGKMDLLKAPKHYPAAVLRYTLCEMSIVWHMYGGKDFSMQPPKKQVKLLEKHRSGATSCPSSPPFSIHHVTRSPSDTHISGMGESVMFSKISPTEVKFKSPSPSLTSLKQKLHTPTLTWRARGGTGRQHDVLMELQLNKVRFQHEVYPENTAEASRQVLLVNEVEIRDRLASSQINKFLYQYSSEARPKQSHANMIVVKAVHVRPDPKLKVQECCLKVSLLPLRLNIDQDSFIFLFNFFSEVSGGSIDEEELSGPCPNSRHTTPTHAAPVMTVNVGTDFASPSLEPQDLLIQLEEEEVIHRSANLRPTESQEDKPPPPPIFFRSFIFTPEVPIRLDYQGKRVDMTHGPFAGLLMGLGQLNCSELRLKRISYRHGLLGIDKLLNFVVSEWLQDIKKNQLPSLLGGVGPMHAVVQLFQGIRDLFWLPIEQYQKDGRIIRGLQRGANSFTTSTAMAALELTNRIVLAIQTTAEMAYDMVSPGPSVCRRSRGYKGKRRNYNQPSDFREGMANAIMLVREGLGETAQTIVRVASEEHEQKGVSGAVGGVLRQIPPTMVKPIILATEATSNVLGGMRSQLAPDARREAVHKWRTQD